MGRNFEKRRRSWNARKERARAWDALGERGSDWKRNIEDLAVPACRPKRALRQNGGTHLRRLGWNNATAIPRAKGSIGWRRLFAVTPGASLDRRALLHAAEHEARGRRQSMPDQKASEEKSSEPAPGDHLQ